MEPLRALVYGKWSLQHAHGDERGHRAVTAAAAAAGAGGSKKIISSMSRENGTKIKSDPNRCAAIQETH
ncbi:Hypothetical predicted protein [Cloeon dipterum]|uniref:Uncharacterized protein n=1 Tax=Cloeon dipterum TaxID=197152 RepID=A0A8S1D4Y6_9INSE|nr:Hypothetical predicted protein [Cloeon dipterum]